MSIEAVRQVARVNVDHRQDVQCSGCGYEWKVNSFVEGVDVEICAVCGCVTIRAKNLSSSRIRSIA
jgi:rRNA maturation endonuclease Nob1